jgi:hypothetical protein
VKTSLSTALVLAAALATSCGGQSARRADSVRSGLQSLPSDHPCRALTATDLTNVGAVLPAREEQLANGPAVHVTCSTLFIDGAGGLILELTQATGGARELARAREAARAQAGSVRPLPHLAPGFVAGSVLAFLHRGQLVTLNAGYSTSGKLQLSTRQLERLALTVAAHQ